MASQKATSASKQLALDLLGFIDASPSPFHAVASSIAKLTGAGYTQIHESHPFNTLQPGKKYFFTRNNSALLAFAVGGKYDPSTAGFSIVGAHTDSPCFKVQCLNQVSPRSRKSCHGYMQVGVQTYGGGLWHTWFDRDLSLAGRVLVKSSTGEIKEMLVDVKKYKWLTKTYPAYPDSRDPSRPRCQRLVQVQQ